MPLNGVEVLETVLRDGLQSPEIKRMSADVLIRSGLEIARLVDSLGYVDIIEAGFAGSSSETDTIIREAAQMGLNARIAAFGQVRAPHTHVEDYKANPRIKSMMDVNTPTVVLVYKSWEHQVRSVLRTTPEENLKMLEDTVRYLKEHGKEVIVDAEFASAAYLGKPQDGLKPNLEYLLGTMRIASLAGADRVVLCDTTGILLPQHIHPLIDHAANAVSSSSKVGFHGHEDHSIGSSLTYQAMLKGASHVQTSFVGTGERAGNASGIELLGLVTSPYQEHPVRMDLTNLKKTAEQVYKLLTGKELPKKTPFVGDLAYTHTGGMHADGGLKERSAYEGRTPEDFGNKSRIHISPQAGRGNIAAILKLDKREPVVERIYQAAMVAMQEGYDLNDGDLLQLIALRSQKDYVPPFKIVASDIGERSVGGSLEDSASLTVNVRGEVYTKTYEGHAGLVDAAATDLVKIISQHYELPQWRLLGWHSDAIDNEGTSQRVIAYATMEFKNGDSIKFKMPGISRSATIASIQAITHGLEYALLITNAQYRS